MNEPKTLTWWQMVALMPMVPVVLFVFWWAYPDQDVPAQPYEPKNPEPPKITKIPELHPYSDPRDYNIQ